MDVLVTYDIAITVADGPRRLARVAAICHGYGVRVQYSVFECRLSPAAFEQLTGELADVIDHDNDRIALYVIPGQLAAARRTIGCGPPVNIGDPWIA